MARTLLRVAFPLAVGAAVVTGCAAIPPSTPGTVAAAIALQPFDNCDGLLDYYQSNALEHITAYGLGVSYYESGLFGAETAVDLESADAATSAGSTTAGTDYSGTNNQEVGVDEADVVKTNGELLITATNSRVVVIDTATGNTERVSLPRSSEGFHELLLHEDTLMVLTSEGFVGHPAASDTSDYPTSPAFGATRTVVTTVDLSDPGAPRTLGSVRMEGSYRSARLIDGTVRLVMVSEPSGVLTTWPTSSSLRAEDEAVERNRELIRETTIEDWIPHAQQIDADGTTGGATALLDCSQISAPEQFSGFATVSVLSFDPADATTFGPTSSAGVIGDGSTVYSSPDTLIVATSPWAFRTWATEDAAIWPGGGGARTQATTDLHVFDISEATDTSYLASGRLDGRLLNQFALSETDGVIRAATTLDAIDGEDSQSSLIILAVDGSDVVETGRVDGLGLDERIYAVRYLNPDLAAVVTFREVDPLYLIDTSDPTDPELLGELKIPGYSAYLHPINDQYLLGVGQDADESNGWTTGAQVSLFDISDLSNPQRVSQVGWEGGYTAAEWDHRAFTHWPQTGEVFLPLEVYHWDDSTKTEEHYAGVVGIGVDTETGELTELHRTAPNERQWSSAPVRTVVIGNALWTIGRDEAQRYDLATLNSQEVIRLS